MEELKKVTIGDGNNDIDMIDYVSMVIAMGNATDHVKSASNYITTSNNQDGNLMR